MGVLRAFAGAFGVGATSETVGLWRANEKRSRARLRLTELTIEELMLGRKGVGKSTNDVIHEF